MQINNIFHCLDLADTCAADRSYAVLIDCEATVKRLLSHVFVELVTTSEIQQCAVKLITRYQPVNRSSRP